MSCYNLFQFPFVASLLYHFIISLYFYYFIISLLTFCNSACLGSGSCSFTRGRACMHTRGARADCGDYVLLILMMGMIIMIMNRRIQYLFFYICHLWRLCTADFDDGDDYRDNEQENTIHFVLYLQFVEIMYC